MPSSPIVIVTGGSRGLGRAAVQALARRGISSILTYNTNKAAAEDEVVEAIGQAGARAVAFQLDTGNTAAFAGFADQVRQTLVDWGAARFDFLVNMQVRRMLARSATLTRRISTPPSGSTSRDRSS